jgi:hypothetical protein
MEFICEWFENNEPRVLGVVAGPIEIPLEHLDGTESKRLFAVGFGLFQLGIVW